MRAVIQAVSSASVRVEGGEPRAIGPGLVILLGVKDTDTLDMVPRFAEKCAGLRIFHDENGKLNRSALSGPPSPRSRSRPTSCFWPRWQSRG